MKELGSQYLQRQQVSTVTRNTALLHTTYEALRLVVCSQTRVSLYFPNLCGYSHSSKCHNFPDFATQIPKLTQADVLSWSTKLLFGL